jgi:photoactive yellow protein
MLSATFAFEQSNLGPLLADMPPEALDELDFGVIGFDSDGVVRAYNALESQLAGLSPTRVLGSSLFTTVAPCMNNFLVAQKFEDAHEQGLELDSCIDYVLTLRMKPVKVKLRMISAPGRELRFVLISRRAT